jgi:hypothetical protein
MLVGLTLTSQAGNGSRAPALFHLLSCTSSRMVDVHVVLSHILVARREEDHLLVRRKRSHVACSKRVSSGLKRFIADVALGTWDDRS